MVSLPFLNKDPCPSRAALPDTSARDHGVAEAYNSSKSIMERTNKRRKEIINILGGSNGTNARDQFCRDVLEALGANRGHAWYIYSYR